MMKEPRKYQLDLVEYSTEKNAIIYLPTGAGKTFIAILLIKRLSGALENTINNGGKRTIFMCNTVELARQHFVELKKNLNLNVGLYVGDRDVDNWHKQQWQQEIKQKQVLVGTAQIFFDIIRQNYLRVQDINLAIFDECHNAVGHHPMLEFLKVVQLDKSGDPPRIIGLTGVLIKGNKQNCVIQEITNLELAFNGKVVTVQNMDDLENVLLFSTRPEEFIISYLSNLNNMEFIEIIKIKVRHLIDNIMKWDIGKIVPKLSKGLVSLREPNKKNFIKNLMEDFIYQMESYGIYAASIAIMSPIIEFEIKKRQSETMALRSLYRYTITFCEEIRHMLVNKLAEFKDEGDNEFNPDSLENIQNYSNDKMRVFLTFLSNEFRNKKKDDISCLVFVERRYTAKCLFFVVKRYVEQQAELEKVILPQFMVGRNTVNSEIESILDRKWNSSAVEQFRSKDCNLIICSSVLEEGIDVQACNYVIVLDRIKTFSSYVQTKGRARCSSSKYEIFTPKDELLKTVKQLHLFKYMHDEIAKFLSTRILDTPDQDENNVVEFLAEPIEPFVTKAGARLTASCAVQILSQYCQSLPSDSFGVVTPKFLLYKKIPQGQIVSLNLPLQSPIRETILSEPMKNTKMAKISASFKACKLLYENQELNDKLKPVSRKECVANIASKLFPHWQKFEDSVGNKMRRKINYRIYNRITPKELCNAVPSPGEPCYLYEFQFIQRFPRNEYSDFLYNIVNDNQSVGILTRKRFPALAQMPLFLHQGRLDVEIPSEPICISGLDAEQLRKLRQHHYLFIRDILDAWNEFYVYNDENKEESFLLVPTLDGEIHWSLVNRLPRLEPTHKYSVEERRNMVFHPEDYIGSVVTKWYENKPNNFLVTRVLTDLNPTCDFEDSSTNTYASYMEQKYGSAIKKVVNQNQFLIEVKELTRRRVFFNSSIGKASEIIRRNHKIILIPELCHNYRYPSTVWFKSFFIPSVLHRLHTMLHAEHLRIRINRFLNLHNMPQNSTCYRPKPIEIDLSLSRTVDLDGNVIEKPWPKKRLEPIPFKREMESIGKPMPENNIDKWKEFLEPFDINRSARELYAVDLEYYFKFIMGLAFESKNILEEEERLYNESQLELPVEQLQAFLVESSNMKKTIDLLERDLDSKFSPIEQYEMVAALTTSNTCDVYDMERFELLGDSFLKFSTSIYLVNRFPKWHEGYLTEVKSKLVSNRNLLYCMLSTDIPGMIQSHHLVKLSYDWFPPLACLPKNILQIINETENMCERITALALYDLSLTEEEIESGICDPDKLTKFFRSCDSEELEAGAVDDLDDVKLANEKLIFLRKMALGNKTVADTLEALLGVIVKNYGIEYGFKVLEFFGVLQSEDGEQPVSNFLDLQFSSRLLRSDVSPREIDGFLVNYRTLEKNLGYSFKDRAYLLQALTHPSYPTNRITGCYQELEFIGDAILDFFISAYIYENYQRMSPGMLTDLRSALVNNTTLACICVRHRFHLFLLAENAMLNESIQKFAEFQQTQGFKVTNQVRILKEESIPANFREHINAKYGYNLAANVEVPKALGDIVEALIAAVYLDSRDLKVTWQIVFRLLKHEILEFSKNVPMDPARQLHEHKFAFPKFSDPIVEDEIVMVKCAFTCVDHIVEVNGFGMNSKDAKKAAAKHALKILSKFSE